MSWRAHLAWHLRWQPLRLLLSLLIVMPSVVRAETASESLSREYEVKGAFLFNFAKYGEWPATSLQVSPFRFCIAGRPDLASWLSGRLRGQRVHGLVIDVINVSGSLESGCHLLFLADNLPAEQQRNLLTTAQKKPVLVIGEHDRILNDGGAVRLFLAEGTVHFDVHLINLSQHGLQLSSKLLRHADEVFGRQAVSGEVSP